MGGNVAGSEMLQHVRQGNRRPAYVHHQSDPGFSGRLLGFGHRFVSVPPGYGIVVHPDLDAEEEPGVCFDRLHRFIHIDDPHVVQSAPEDTVGSQPDRADVQKRDQSRPVRRKHIVPHRSVVQESRAPRIHPGRNAAAQAGLVRVYCGPAAAVVEMAVQVDQARRNQLPGHVD